MSWLRGSCQPSAASGAGVRRSAGGRFACSLLAGLATLAVTVPIETLGPVQAGDMKVMLARAITGLLGNGSAWANPGLPSCQDILQQSYRDQEDQLDAKPYPPACHGSNLLGTDSFATCERERASSCTRKPFVRYDRCPGSNIFARNASYCPSPGSSSSSGDQPSSGDPGNREVGAEHAEPQPPPLVLPVHSVSRTCDTGLVAATGHVGLRWCNDLETISMGGLLALKESQVGAALYTAWHPAPLASLYAAVAHDSLESSVGAGLSVGSEWLSGDATVWSNRSATYGLNVGLPVILSQRVTLTPGARWSGDGVVPSLALTFSL